MIIAKGTIKFVNGDVYHGALENGKPNGLGTYTWSDGSHYEGQFSEGVRHGYGSWQSSNGNSYQGGYQYDKRCGFGIFTWPSGAYYEGNFFNDLRQGFGTLVWSNGVHYKGNWNLGKKHGQGRIFESFIVDQSVDGTIVSEGYFEDDRLVQDLTDQRSACARCSNSYGRTTESISYDQSPQHLSRSIDETITRRQLKPLRPNTNATVRIKQVIAKPLTPWIPNGIARGRRLIFK